jgi:STIP1 family protein 1
MAARKRGEWERVESDAGSALGLSPGEREAMKGHYLLGLAMGARGQHDRSTHHLRKVGARLSACVRLCVCVCVCVCS